MVSLRTSGTEPKIKYYSEYADETQAKAQEVLDDMMINYFLPLSLKPEENGLIPPPK